MFPFVRTLSDVAIMVYYRVLSMSRQRPLIPLNRLWVDQFGLKLRQLSHRNMQEMVIADEHIIQLGL